jgi:hypothetical protein
MIEACSGFGFSTKTFKRFRTIGMKAQDTFQRDNATGMALTRAINDPHPAAPNLLQDLVVTDAPLGILNIDFV